MAGRGPNHIDARRRDRGQVLVLFALSIVVILGFAGLAFDVGRFYSERRFLQNAVDAAALAAANALIGGATDAQADTTARDVLTRNFEGDPNGIPPSLPPATPVYEDGYPGQPTHLLDGILISGCDVRVAVRNPVSYTFGRVVGLDRTTIGARAHVACDGDYLPIAVRQFVGAPGPNAGPPTSPCPDNQNQFNDFFATADTTCLGTDTDRALRSDPSPGSNFDPANPANDTAYHGPIVTILGQGAQPSNGVDFRGFVSLDVRNFATSTSQLYYNGVTSGTNPQTLKQMEANYTCPDDGRPPGYPGPAFPPPTSPPDPNDQVGIMSGNSTGIVIDRVNKCFGPGAEVLVLVYPGTVMAIPDFAISMPQTVVLPETGTTANAGSFKISRNQAFSGTVTLNTLPDILDPANPLNPAVGTLNTPNSNPDPAKSPDAVAYSPNPVTPSLGGGTNVSMDNMVTAGAAPGVYALWIQGQAGSPYLTTKYTPFALQVGTVTKDFKITANASSQDATNVGDTVLFTLTLQNAPNKNTPFGNPVALSLDAPYPSGTGAVAFSSNPVAPTKPGESTTLSINTGTMAPGAYTFVVRATADNGDGQKVTHLISLTVNVAPTGSTGSQDYVDIVGWAVMRIVAGDSNAISAYAITPLITDPNDQRLRRGQVARLAPWN
jgi:hypothetical protein